MLATSFRNGIASANDPFCADPPRVHAQPFVDPRATHVKGFVAQSLQHSEAVALLPFSRGILLIRPTRPGMNERLRYLQGYLIYVCTGTLWKSSSSAAD